MSYASDVVAAARKMAAAGMVTGSAGNVSVRLPGGGALITPTGLPYDGMDEDDLVHIAADGRVASGSHVPSRESPTHLAVYACRPDVHAVVHSHSPHATAWSFLGEELALPTEELEVLGGEIATAEHRSTGSQELAGSVATALGDRRGVLMARHGAVGVGADLDGALAACSLIEHQAQVQLLVRTATLPALAKPAWSGPSSWCGPV